MATKKKTVRTTKGAAKVETVMGEYKRGKLKSSSGEKVTDRKQAVAIALSEAREAGADIPEKPAAKKSAAKKKPAAKKANRKTAAKKSRKRA
jgi:hypothetical protein